MNCMAVEGVRDLRHSVLSTALIVIIAVSILSGCSGKKSEVQQPAKQLQQGGQLVYGSLQEPNTLNPLLSDLLATAEVGSLIFSGLVVTNDRGQWVPDLAAEVPSLQNGGVSPDGLTVTYRLRPGVVWHDGTPFTANDVKFTWQTIMNKRNEGISREGYDRITSIEVPDKQTVVIRFRDFYAPYLTLFPVVLPQHKLEGVEDLAKAPFNRSPVGTGPFKFREWRIADAIVLDANPSYHLRKPVLDSIVYRIIPDMTILLSQLKAGTLDVVSNIPLTQLESVKALEGIRLIVTPGRTWEHIDFNLDNALFQDTRVRQAILMAVDKQALVATALKGAAVIAATDQSPLSWVYNPALKPVPRDVNRARELLAQAGWTLGEKGIYTKDGQNLAFSLTTTSGNKTREAVAAMLVQQLKEVGIQLDVRYLDVPLFFGDTLKNRRFETAMYAWVVGVDPDNHSFWHSRQIPGRSNGYEGQNYPGWRNTEVDNLTEQGLRTVNGEERKQIYYRIQDIFVQDVPVIPLYFRSSIDAVKNSVANYKPNNTPAGNLWNAYEWGVLK